MSIVVGDALVHGVEVDARTRCAHYRSVVDIVAIQFRCCLEWYCCLHCHERMAGHPIRAWQADETTTEAVLCGECGERMTIAQYLGADRCPRCAATFNAGCALHHPVYFG